MFDKIYKNDKIVNHFILLFFFIINTIYFYLHLSSNISVDPYSYNELFVNYQSGFIRRGLLGEIAWQLKTIFQIEFINFFSTLFYLIHIINFLLLFSLLKKYFENKLFFIFFIFSPTLILFHIYDPSMYYIKDSLIKLSILLHAYIFQRYDLTKYIKFLIFLIFPLLTILILIHEYQLFFITIHLLITLGKIKKNSDLLKYYFFLVPALFVIIYSGTQQQFEQLSKILNNYDVYLNPHLSGGLYKYIGAFYKWHFYYFGYKDFINLMLSIILTLIIPYLIFQTFLDRKIIELYTNKQKKYLLFFLPTLIPFFFTTDHGRNLSLIAFHILSFYFILKLDYQKLDSFFKKINKTLLAKIIILIFIFFYLFLWKLDQFAGFQLQGKPNGIFKSSFFGEIVKLIKYLYYYVDLNIYKLPPINL